MKYYSPTDLAKMAHRGRTTIWNWIKSGKIPVQKLPNGNYIILETDIPTFIRNRGDKS